MVYKWHEARAQPDGMAPSERWRWILDGSVSEKGRENQPPGWSPEECAERGLTIGVYVRACENETIEEGKKGKGKGVCVHNNKV